ncbi:hypothetical protein [Yersinia massiliensis]|uniref:hypothetical protein n=1 Tax=Yersinia massiliensis TaxID=419257 RepID=UPI0005B6332E|nr:hypothetical protein [Yersinia massiliensis]
MSVAPLETRACARIAWLLCRCFGFFGLVWFGLVIGSVDMKSAFTLALMPQPPMGSQARDPLGAPALAHVSLACFAGAPVIWFGDRFGCYHFGVHLGSDASTAKWAMSVAPLETRASARIACLLRRFPHSSFRLTDGFIRIPAHGA